MLWRVFTIPLTGTKISASLVTFANILTCILGGLMGQHIGRKNSMLLMAPVSILAFICQALAPNKGLLGPILQNFYFINYG